MTVLRRGIVLGRASGVFALVTLLACGSGGRPPDIPAPPSALTYAENPATYTVSVLVAGNTPTSGGGAVSSYSVAPPLPPGLSLDERTGVISGMPTAVSAVATYTVTAKNVGGSTTAEVVLSVNDLPPAELTYGSSVLSFTRGVAIAPQIPSHTGGAVASYSVEPQLPPGLSFDGATGRITGTPTSRAAEASYTVTATNPFGNSPVTLTITVNGNPPRNLTYSTNPGTYVKGLSITPNVPRSEGGAVTSYSTDGLPPGLQLDPTTGAIYGTPTVVSAPTSYRVTARNEDGTGWADLTLSVSDVLCTASLAIAATSPGQTAAVQLSCAAVGAYWIEYAGAPTGATAVEQGAVPVAGTQLWAHSGSAAWTVTLDPGTAAIGDYPLAVKAWRSTSREQGTTGPTVSWGIAPPIELIVVAGGVLDPIFLQ